MYNKQLIKDETELVQTFKMLAQAYEEISVIKMQKVRSSVLSAREFLQELSEVFSDVKGSYKDELLALIEKRKRRKALNPLAVFGKSKKTIAVLLSANAKLYGDIINRVTHLFIEDCIKNDYDMVIIGRYGKDLYESQNVGKSYSYFEIPDTGASFEQLLPIFKFLSEYEKVNVYYGLFNNVVIQTPTVSNITGEEPLIGPEQVQGKEGTKYIFEPSLERIYSFFKDQVLVALFKQTIHEAELARLASRITAMEQALGNIQDTEQQLKGDLRRVIKRNDNKKQIDSFSGLSLWKSSK